MSELVLSALPKTWVLDLDGTLLKHNGYLNGEDELLDGVKLFIDNIPEKDFILILSARSSEYKKRTEDFLRKSGIRYDAILYDVPFGERILINDKKTSGLLMSHSVNLERDVGLGNITIKIDESL